MATSIDFLILQISPFQKQMSRSEIHQTKIQTPFESVGKRKRLVQDAVAGSSINVRLLQQFIYFKTIRYRVCDSLHGAASLGYTMVADGFAIGSPSQHRILNEELSFRAGSLVFVSS